MHTLAGVVYKGVWQGVDVAVKFIVSDSFSEQLESAREAVLSRSVGHPYVIHTYAYHVTKVWNAPFKQALLASVGQQKQLVLAH